MNMRALLWSLCSVLSWQSMVAQSIWLNGEVRDHYSKILQPAVWQWTDSESRIVLERSTDASGFADFVPSQAKFLQIVSAGYRTVRLPVHWRGISNDTYRFKAEIPLIPIDKVTDKQPYFQSEQKPLQLTRAASVSNFIPVHFSIIDALTNRPVRADLCLFFTKSHKQACYKTTTLQTNLIQQDIVAIEVSAPKYQPYLGNVVVSTTPQMLQYVIRLNPTPTLLMVAAQKTTETDTFQVKAIPSGVTYNLPANTQPMLLLPPGDYYFASNKRQMVYDTIRVYEGLNAYAHSVENVVQSVPAMTDQVIMFAQSSYELSDQAKQKLNKIVLLMQNNAHWQLRIVGHTDSVGNPHLNNILSEYRARITRAYLHRRGIAEGRLSIEAVGSNQPIVPNDTEENRRRNRRVSLHFQ